MCASNDAITSDAFCRAVAGEPVLQHHAVLNLWRMRSAKKLSERHPQRTVHQISGNAQIASCNFLAPSVEGLKPRTTIHALTIFFAGRVSLLFSRPNYFILKATVDTNLFQFQRETS